MTSQNLTRFCDSTIIDPFHDNKYKTCLSKKKERNWNIRDWSMKEKIFTFVTTVKYLYMIVNKRGPHNFYTAIFKPMKNKL